MKVHKGILSFFLSMALTFPAFSTVTSSSAIDVGIAGSSAEEMILSQKDATLQKYSVEDLKATKAFIFNQPYDGEGRVIDANEDSRIDVFDLCTMKRDYKKTGNYYNLLYQMIEESESKYSIALSDGTIYSNRIIVRTDCDYDFSKYGAKAILMDTEHKYILQFDSREKIEYCLSDLQNAEHILYAELDDSIEIPIDNSDGMTVDIESEIASYSWGAYTIEAEKLAEHIKKDYNQSVTVAVVDSGVANHSFLNSRVLESGYDIINNDKDPSDDSIGHGTHVAGTIVDCTPNLSVNILPVKVFNGRSADSSVISTGIKYAREIGVDVINLSLGGNISQDIDYEVKLAVDAGITVVVAAGNERKDTSGVSPARNSECIVVSAIDASMSRADFSNFGQSVDVCAPGVNIKSSVPGGGFDYKSGTSMAAPHIAAAAAMIKCMDSAASPSQVESTLVNACRDLGTTGKDIYYGYGVPKLSKLIKEQIPPTITLSKSSETLYKGQKYTLSASVTPGDVYVNWTTSNSSVATVSNGVVTANGEGTATITAFFTYNGTNYPAQCKVTVKKPGIELSESNKTVYQTNTFNLNADTLPKNQTVFWSTSNSNVATVSNDGNVTAINPGTATITASFTYAGETYSASCNVTVKEVSIKLDKSSNTVYQTDEFLLNATVTPSGQKVTWSTSNSNVATVSDGKVVAVNPGTANITASFVYGGKTFSASCSVTVKKVSIELDAHSKSLIIGDTSTINATTSPSGLSVSWESTNNMIASVNNGKITAKAPGSININATMSYNGKEYSDSCSVTVVEPSVKISQSQVKISKNETFQLYGETLPSGQTINWTSEDTNICTINSTGKVTGKNTGNTMIYATITYGGISYKTSCNVIVGEPKVTLDKSLMTMYVSDTQSLIASVIAVDGMDISSESKSDITWSSSDSSVATVSSNGSVSAIAKGTATITATYSFCGVKYTATCKVNVNGKPGITLNPSSKSMYIGDTYTLIETITPSNATVTWSSSNSSVATVNSYGKVSAISNGTATITASIRYNGVTYYDECTINVIRPSITFDVTNKSLYPGDSFTIYETVKPSGYSVTWSTSNSSVATVNSNGTVTAKNAGTATITGKFTYAGNSYSATCSVTVKSISLSLSSYSGRGSQNVWDGTYLNDGSACGNLVNLPSESYSPSGSISWSIINGDAKIVNGNSQIFFMQPGTVTARCTLSYNGYTVYKDYTYSLSLYKTTNGNNNIRTSPSSGSSAIGVVPKGATVTFTQLHLNGTAGNSGASWWGKMTYNGVTGWIIISQW